LILVNDESGSMSSQTAQVIEGVNAMLEEQRKPRNDGDGAAAGEGQVFFSLVTFNNASSVKIDRALVWILSFHSQCSTIMEEQLCMTPLAPRLCD